MPDESATSSSQLRPKVVFLHGIGRSPKTLTWLNPLNEILRDLGHPAIAAEDVILPSYFDVLGTASPPDVKGPNRVVPTSEENRRGRQSYEYRQARLHGLVGLESMTTDTGFASIPSDWHDPVASIVEKVESTFKQARRYIDSERMRSTVLWRVLEKLPDKGDLVLLGHSLGSLVAIDLLDVLPTDLHVKRLITFGSPAGMPYVHERGTRLLRDFPYSRVDSWLNVLSPLDHVTAGRGLSSIFPAALDVRIKLPVGEHGAKAYLTMRGVADAVGDAVHGSRSTEVARQSGDLAVGLGRAEAHAIFGLSYAHWVGTILTRRDKAEGRRYLDAVASVQQEVHLGLVRTLTEMGRPIAPEIDALVNGAAPRIPQVWELDEGVRLLVVSATSNLIAPWVIDTTKSSRDALLPAASALGYAPNTGEKIRDAIVAARKGLGLDKDNDWQKILLGAAGIAIIAAGPVGLALAAPAGLAGGAAIVSALAAFGPGGMVGGMALAGALVGTGAVTATAATLSKAPHAAVELEVLRRMAHALARKSLGLAPDPADWLLLVSLESELAREYDMHRAFSDMKAAEVRDVERKKDVVSRAIRWMSDRELGPKKIAG